MQARVRAGESAQDVASTTGWDVSKVLRYAEPLLAERAFMAQQAASVEVRRSGGGATLAEACAAVLGSDEAEAVAWDSYRRDDGRWIVTATLGDGTVAAWTYDHHGRNLHPVDDRARVLMGATPLPAQDADIDIAAALDLVGDVSVVREEAPARPHLVAVPSSSESVEDADEALDDVMDVSTTLDNDTPVASPDEPSSGGYEQETLILPREAPAKPERKPRGRKGRTSVPSWDEILFGAGRADD